MAAGMDPYRVLGLGRNAGVAEVKRAYHAAALRVHPDVAKGPKKEAERKFRELTRAYRLALREALLAEREQRPGTPRRGVPPTRLAQVPGAGGGPTRARRPRHKVLSSRAARLRGWVGSIAFGLFALSVVVLPWRVLSARRWDAAAGKFVKDPELLWRPFWRSWPNDFPWEHDIALDVLIVEWAVLGALALIALAVARRLRRSRRPWA